MGAAVPMSVASPCALEMETLQVHWTHGICGTFQLLVFKTEVFSPSTLPELIHGPILFGPYVTRKRVLVGKALYNYCKITSSLVPISLPHCPLLCYAHPPPPCVNLLVLVGCTGMHSLQLAADWGGQVTSFGCIPFWQQQHTPKPNPL